MTTENRKIYRGFANPFGNRVHVVEGGHTEPLNHIVRHSPDGFSWGFHGSGPAELAHCLLVDHLGAEVEPAVYQAFKADVIAGFPADQDWIMTSEFIDDWLAACSEIEQRQRFVAETEVINNEIELLSAMVECEVCGYGPAPAVEMVRERDGWVCWPCSRGEAR